MIRFAAAALVAAAALTAPAAQANTSGAIRLNGTVALDCTIAVTDLNQALSLRAGESNRPVGQVVETCNAGTGYQISVSSKNAGKLVSAGGSQIDYQVAYDGQAGKLDSGLAVARASAQFGRTSALTVSLQGSDRYIAGSYEDTVTITIAAK